MSETTGRTVGPWQDRVVFSPEGGGVAYRPGEVYVRSSDAERTEGFLGRERDAESGSFTRFGTEEEPLVDPVAAVHDLRLDGIAAQLNHVLFSHCCCCGPHPASGWGANPFQANPFQANPFQANAHGRRHTARPARAPRLPSYPGNVVDRSQPSIVVLDTGLAGGQLRPYALHGLPAGRGHTEMPDEDCDGCIDPVAGHGTFIAGIIERTAPGCELSVLGILGGYGDADEMTVAQALEGLVDPDTRTGPDLVNLSFGGYALGEMERLAQAVRRLQASGSVVVASAGNDSSCRRTYPAALPGVVSVGALGPNGPAPFTNYGDWVRACAPGVGVVSTFFNTWEPQPGDGERYAEWVSWSGTSFAAPAVVGALARCMREGLTGPQAVAHLLDDPALLRWPQLGTVVNSTPCWQI